MPASPRTVAWLAALALSASTATFGASCNAEHDDPALPHHVPPRE